MIRFTATIKKFSRKGEKTGWSYVEITHAQASRLKPGVKTSFKVKGTVDHFPIRQTSLLPMGDGDFILPMNGTLRKALGKTTGDTIALQLEADATAYKMNQDFMTCLRDDPTAKEFFYSLPGSHQRYFSKWIDSAKTEHTKTRRIVIAITALSRNMGYGEMIRSAKTL
jgi:hypothetical protein